jgi:hypothetical protein
VYAAQPPGDPVRIRVARQQRDLEKQHAGGPHRRAAAHARQDQARDHRLNLKKKEGAKEDGRAE